MASLAWMGSFFTIVVMLVALDVLSWIRTGALRRGRVIRRTRAPPAATSFSSSMATFLPSLAGMAAVAWGVGGIGRNRPQALALMSAGLFIAFAGLIARVTGVRADRQSVVVTKARRRPFRARWPELRALTPPANPLGGWRLEDVCGNRTTLMPSDLWGHEGFLRLIVLRADLRFDGRRWFRGHGSTWLGLGRSPPRSIGSVQGD